MKKLLLASAFLSMASFAHAGDIKNYSAGGCMIKSENSADYDVSVLGYIRNNSTTNTLSVMCPLVRDSSGGNTFNDAWVQVIDRHPTENIRCALYRTAPAGNSGGGSVKYSSGSSYTAQKLTFPSGTFSNSEYTFQLNCTLPAKSGNTGSSIQSFSAASN